MPISKKIIHWCLVLSAIFLLVTLLLEVKALRELEIAGIRIQTYQNVALGLFGSAAVGCAMSMATYFYEKVKFLKALWFALNDTCHNLAKIKNEFQVLEPGGFTDVHGLVAFLDARLNSIETHLRILNESLKEISTSDYDGFIRQSRIHFVLGSLDDIKDIANRHMIHAIESKISLIKLNSELRNAEPTQNLAPAVLQVQNSYVFYQTMFVELETRAKYALVMLQTIERK